MAAGFTPQSLDISSSWPRVFLCLVLIVLNSSRLHHLLLRRKPKIETNSPKLLAPSLGQQSSFPHCLIFIPSCSRNALGMDRPLRAEPVPVEPALDLKPCGCGTWGHGLVVALDSIVSELFSNLNDCAVLCWVCSVSRAVAGLNEFPLPALALAGSAVAFQFGEFQ